MAMLKLFLSIKFSFISVFEGCVSPWRLRGQQSVVAHLRNKEKLNQVGFHKFSALFFFPSFFLPSPVTLTSYFTKPVWGSPQRSGTYVWLRAWRTRWRSRYLYFAICLRGRDAASAISGSIPSAQHAAHQLLRRCAPLTAHVAVLMDGPATVKSCSPHNWTPLSNISLMLYYLNIPEERLSHQSICCTLSYSSQMLYVIFTYDWQTLATRKIMNLSPHTQSEPHLSTLGSYQVKHLFISFCVTQARCTHNLNQSTSLIGSPLLHDCTLFPLYAALIAQVTPAGRLQELSRYNTLVHRCVAMNHTLIWKQRTLR